MGYLDEMYPSTPNIDGRGEFERLLRGDIGVVRIGRDVILRRVSNVHCACWDGLTGGPIACCSYCNGEGYHYTEEEIVALIADGVAPMYKPGVLGSGNSQKHPVFIGAGCCRVENLLPRRAHELVSRAVKPGSRRLREGGRGRGWG